MRGRRSPSLSISLLPYGLLAAALAGACSRTDPDGERPPVVLVDARFPGAAGGASPNGGTSGVGGATGGTLSAGGASPSTGGATSQGGVAGATSLGGLGGTTAAGGASTGGASGGSTTIPSCDDLPLGSGNCVSGTCKTTCKQLPGKCGGADGKVAMSYAPPVCINGTCTQSALAEDCPGICVAQGNSASCHAGATGTGGAPGAGGAPVGVGGAPVGVGGAAVGGSSSTGGSSGCVSQPGEVCDPVCQNCPGGDKCTVANGPMGSIFTECTNKKGPGLEGEVCMRQMLGSDTCDAGLVCTIYGAASNGGPMAPKTCRRFCHDTPECADIQETCVQFGGQQTPQQGVCVPTCQPFQTGACGPIAGSPGTCAQTYGDIATSGPVFTCRASAPNGPQGAQCMADTDCASDAICLGPWNGSQTCGKLCDASTPCPGNTACQTFTTLPNGDALGYCF